jgi:hypothetical protein
MKGSAEGGRVVRRASVAVAVAGLLALAALVLRSGPPETDTPGLLARHGGLLSLLVAGVLLGGITAIRRYREVALSVVSPSPLAERLTQAVLVLLSLATAVLPLSLIWFWLRSSHPSGGEDTDLTPPDSAPADPSATPSATVDTRPLPVPSQHVSSLHGNGFVLLCLLALVVFVAAVLLVLRTRVGCVPGTVRGRWWLRRVPRMRSRRPSIRAASRCTGPTPARR